MCRVEWIFGKSMNGVANQFDGDSVAWPFFG